MPFRQYILALYCRFSLRIGILNRVIRVMCLNLYARQGVQRMLKKELKHNAFLTVNCPYVGQLDDQIVERHQCPLILKISVE